MLICLSLILLCPMSRSKLHYQETWVEDTHRLLKEKINRFSDHDLEVLKQKRGMRTLQNRWFDPKLESRIIKIHQIKDFLEQREKNLDDGFEQGTRYNTYLMNGKWF